MKCYEVKNKLKEIAQTYLKAYPIETNSGHKHHDKANFILELIKYVNDKTLLLATMEQIIAAIPEWNAYFKGTVNSLHTMGLWSKPLIGSCLKTDLNNLAAEIKKEVSANDKINSRYVYLATYVAKELKNQLRDNKFITDFDIKETEHLLRYHDGTILYQPLQGKLVQGQ